MAFFADALQGDVTDSQHGTAAEGVHLGAMAGTVDQVLRVSTGIEVKDDVLLFNPELPPEMERREARIRYRGQSWLRLSEQFPAKDKWCSAGFGIVGTCRVFVAMEGGRSPTGIATNTRRRKIQAASAMGSGLK
jgi:hypothetical protein